MKQKGHLAALTTILIWGMTYVATKVLLQDFRPVEVLVLRFVIAYAALMMVCPRAIHFNGWRQELIFAAGGLTGVTLYFLFQNFALEHTMASNASVIISTAPFFTAMAGRFLFRSDEKIKPMFYIGFVIAMTGICLISFGGENVQTHLLGDVLALLSAMVWAFYAYISKKMGTMGFSTLQITRRVFFYGLLFMIPALFMMDFGFDPALLIQPRHLINLLFLGLGASALCFVTWNYAVKAIGAVSTSVYIYLEPVITIVSSVFVLKEQLSPTAMAGAGLALTGLILSEWSPANRKHQKTVR